MEPDYPAAHSMDTRWFAVDRVGHVACFDSGEAGAVPEQGGSEEALMDDLARLLPRNGAAYDPNGRVCPGPNGDMGRHHARSEGDAALLFLRSLDAVRAEIAAGTAIAVPATEGAAVIFRQLTEDIHRRLHDAGDCLSCFYLWGLPDDEELGPDLTSRGFFEYDHLTENWISGPYGRIRIPLRPLHVDQLPPQIRDRAKRVRLDLRFADTPHIQPVEHGTCVSWESAWLDVTGTHIRPIPGCDKGYPAAYEYLRSMVADQLDNQLDIQPPPDATGDANEE